MNNTGKVSVELGNYAKANCYWAPCGDLPDKGVGRFSPFLKVFKQKGVYELHIVCFTTRNFELDSKNPLVFDYLGKEVFIFLNLNKVENGQEKEWQYFVIRVHFSSEFSTKLTGKKIFVMPVHGDPEEGDVAKVIVEDEDEID